MRQLQESMRPLEAIPAGLQSDWKCRQQAWEHLGTLVTNLGAPVTNLGVPATSLGAPLITVEQSGKNNIFLRNAAGAPGNHSYYFSLNDF